MDFLLYLAGPEKNRNTKNDATKLQTWNGRSEQWPVVTIFSQVSTDLFYYDYSQPISGNISRKRFTNMAHHIFYTGTDC